MVTKRDRKIPAAASVQWIGLCSCGCGAFKAVLVDQNDKFIATFGWDREGWVDFLAGVMGEIDGESNDGIVCEHHTAH
jgi:hypothetical protein